MRLLILVSILFLSVYKILSLNILAILPYNGKSHFIVYSVFIKELANRGHNVTVISHFPEKDPPKNYKDITLVGSQSANKGTIGAMEFSYYFVFLISQFLTNTGIQDCEVLMANEDVQSLVKSKPKFDVVVVEQFNSDCALGVAYKLGAPVVGILSSIQLPYHYERFGIPDNPSYVPFHFFGGGTKPTFFQRIERVLFKFYFKYLYYYTQWMNQKTLAKYFEDIPPLEELGREIKFLLLYQNFVLTGSKLLPANVIEVGGYHVKEAKPLTGDLKKFIEEAKDGIVFISFGSMINSDMLPLEKVQAILEAIKDCPQKFIWKIETNTLFVDKDKVYSSSWLPQVDILGHPNTLAFISHGGMGSTTEALHFGVPIIVVPFLGDQPSNAAAIEEIGLGVQLQYKDLTKNNLVAVLKKVLDPEFRKGVKEITAAWHDRPLPPLDTAVFWTEFAAKHPNFTYRTAAADVPLYQYLYLDILTTLLVVLAIFGVAIRTCCYRRPKQKIMKIKSKRE